MQLELAGKVAAVTGSSRGIGRGIALALAAEGCRLVLTGRDRSALESVAGEVRGLGAEVEQFAGDLRDPAAAEGLIGAAALRFGRLDILVNNAGATKRGDFFSLSDADFLDGFALKFLAHVRLSRLAWPLLKARGGSLLQIVGVGARTPTADFTIGASVNAACLAFIKALAEIGRRDGVQVNAVNPGMVETARLRPRIDQLIEEEGLDEAGARARLVEGFATRIGQPADIGALAAFILSPRGRWLHGSLIDIDGGATRGV
jgi:3-oxoacyl-[acyl-carrier protein] reductase